MGLLDRLRSAKTAVQKIVAPRDPSEFGTAESREVRLDVRRIIEGVELSPETGSASFIDNTGKRIQAFTLPELRRAIEEVADANLVVGPYGYGWGEGAGIRVTYDGDRIWPLESDPSSYVADELALSPIAKFFVERSVRGRVIQWDNYEQAETGNDLWASLEVPREDFLIEERVLEEIATAPPSPDAASTETDRVFSLSPLVTLPVQEQYIQVANRFSYLLNRANVSPEILHELAPRQFEELVAELWKKLGYGVELTARTRDGGCDIIAIKDSEIDLRILIECKKYDPRRKVGVELVRRLYGVKLHEQATKAVLATTSTFTLPASTFIEAHQWELEGRDLKGILNWIEIANQSNKL